MKAPPGGASCALTFVMLFEIAVQVHLNKTIKFITSIIQFLKDETNVIEIECSFF